MDTARHPITLSVEAGIAIANLDRPPVNAIDDAWVARLEAIVDEVEARDDVRVLWIRSAGRAFCAGADLALMRERFPTDEGRAKMVDLTRAMQRVFARIERSPRVSIAEIGGAAFGGGLELAMPRAESRTSACRPRSCKRRRSSRPSASPSLRLWHSPLANAASRRRWAKGWAASSPKSKARLCCLLPRKHHALFAVSWSAEGAGMYQEKPWLDWPFFDAKHRELARAIDEWCARELRQPDHGDVDAACRELVKRLGAAGWLRYAIGGVAYGATADTIDTRAICLLRETLARHSGLADFASGMPT